MLRIREDGIFTESKQKSSAFDGILLGTHNENDGCKLLRPLMTISVATNPTAAETIGIGTKTYTFVASGATGDQINIGTLAADTAVNIMAKINSDKSACGCAAYPLGSATLICLVSNDATEPVFTADGAKVVQDLAWALTVDEAHLESTSYFKKPLTDADTKPIVLTTHYYGGVSGYQNFLY